MTAFTPEEIRSFLAEHVTVVTPGETLVIRVDDLTPGQMREYQQMWSDQYDAGCIPFRAVVVHGAELGVAAASEIEDAVRFAVRDELARQTAGCIYCDRGESHIHWPPGASSGAGGRSLPPLAP